MGRPGRVTWMAVAVMAVVVVLCVAGFLAWRSSHDRTSSSTATVAVPDGLQFGLQPATGVRTGAPTAVSGTVVNTGSAALPVAFTISSLPAGSSSPTVVPAVSATSSGWSCASMRCTWVGAGGSATTLTANSTAPLMIAFDAPPSAAEQELTVVVDGLAPSSVPLSLPNGAQPLAADAIAVSMSAPSTVLLGTPVNGKVRVTNFSPTTVAAGATTVTVSPPAIAGLTVTPSGDGWTCSGTTCTYTATLATFDVTAPLQLAESAPAGGSGGTGSLAVSATATAGSTTITAAATKDVEVRPARSTSVSTRIVLDSNSLVEGSTVDATIAVTPIGAGVLSDAVTVGLELPTGVRADWSAATSTGPWSCADDGCSSTAPLDAGSATTIVVPLTVAPGTRPGTVHLTSRTTVASGSDASEQRSATASLVVVAPPTAQLRARLLAATGADPRGAAVVFAPGAPRAMQLEVTDRGPSSLRAGSTVVVVATPSKDVRLQSVGGNGWTCSPTVGIVSRSLPLECRTTLTEDLLPDVPLSVPVTLAPDGPSDSDWLVGAGTSTAAANENRMRTRVSVVAQAPRFVPSIVTGSPLHVGGTGQILVDVTNHSDELASGGVAVVTVPAGATVVRSISPAWNCVVGDVAGANGVVTCATTSIVGPRGSAPPIILEVAISGSPSQIEVSAWSTAVGQFDAGRAEVIRATLPIASAVVIDAGSDLTVITPQTGPNGAPAPAVVQLTGTTDLATAKSLAWTQRCTVAGEEGCGAIVTPTVTWLGVPVGRAPTTLTARFTAPEITGPEELLFRLTGLVGSTSISDDVTVRLIPPSAPVTASGSAPSSAGSESAPGTASTSGSSPGVLVPPSAGPTAVAPTASIAGSGTVLQVPTRAGAQLVGGGTGTGPLTFEWSQTSGPDATILGGSASQSTLQFTTPTLDPSQQDETLTFELTVTDATGATATSSIDVEVIWGDAGLIVTLAGGAANVVTTIDGPVSITSSVQSRGAPYTYAWSVGGFELPSGSAVDASSLAFAAPSTAADGTATLVVTDSFGRVTTASIPVIVSALPAGQIPAAFCAAISTLRSGDPAVIGGVSQQFTIPSATISTPTCTSATVVSFSNASASLPGGIALSSASGQLTIAGVSVTSATVSAPSNWTISSATIGAGGLLAPFVSSTAIGVPSGSITAASTPFLAPTGWAGSTTVTFTSSPVASAIVSATSNGTAPGAAMQLTGTSIGGATTARLSASGVLAIGTVDVPIEGTISTSSGTASPTYAVNGTVTSATPLAAGVSVVSAMLSWTPQQATGDITLAIGQGSTALVLDSPTSVVTSTATTFTFPGTVNQWSTATGAPPFVLGGSGSVQGGQLVIGATSLPSGAWVIGSDLALGDLQMTVAIDCPLDASTTCVPTLTAGATATSPTFAAPTAVSGPFDPSTGVTTLTGAAGSITVSPLVVTGSALTVGLSPQGAPTATASGTATVLGASASATVVFGSTSTLADVDYGPLTMVSGWQIPSVSVLATTAPFEYTATIASADNATVTVPIAAGALTGVGVTQLPSSLVGDSIPADVTTGLASFAIGNGPVTSYSVTAPVATPWFLAGAAGTDLSLSITSITFEVEVNGAAATVTMDGSAVLSASAIDGSPTSIPMTFTNGNLASGAMNVTFVSSTTTAWTNAFGVDGVGATDVTLTYQTTATGPQVTLGGTLLLPSSLLSAIGAPSTATPTFTTEVTDGSLCVSADLTTGGANGVDIGGYGLVYSPSSYLVFAPSNCTFTDNSVGAGISLVFADSTFGALVVDVDPVTFGLSDSIEQDTLDVGGLTLSNATVAITSGASGLPGTPAQPAITVSGSLTIGSSDVAVSAIAQGAAGAVGSLTFTATGVPVTLDWLSIPSATVAVTVPTVVATIATDAMVTVAGATTVLGATITPSLTGTLVGGQLTQLSGTVPSQSYALANGDTYSGELTVAFDSSPATSIAPLSISGTGTLSIAESTSTTRIYAVSDLSVVSATSLSIEATTGYATTAIAGTSSPFVGVSGTYSLSDGTYSFTNPTSATPTLAGYTPSTDVTFARAGSTVTAEQVSTFDMGLFDDDVQTVMSGTLSVGPVPSVGGPTTATATLTGSTNGQMIRGLAGTASFSVAPAPSSAQTVTGSVVYVNSVTFATDAGDCALWSSNPTLTGIAYRSQTGTSDGNTFYTLAGSTDLFFPGGISFSNLAGMGNQPVVLTNEVLPDAPTTSGFSITVPFDAGAISAMGTAAFDFAECSFSLGGTAVINVSGSDELESALGQQQGLQVQLGSLFGDGNTLPPSTMVARALYQAESVGASFAQQANAANIERATAAATLTTRAEAAATANVNLQNAQTALQQANADLPRAAAQALGGVGSALVTYFTSGGNLAASQAALDQAQQSLDEAKAAVTTATATLATRTTEVQAATTQLEAANAEVERTTQAADAAAESASNSPADPKVVQLSVDWTHCLTCSSVDSLTASGELNVGLLVVEGDLEFQFGESGITSAQVTIGGGFEEQRQIGTGSLGIFLQGEFVLEVTGGRTFPPTPNPSWTDLSATLSATADADVYLDTWCCNFNEQLASLELQGSVQFFPTPMRYSASGEIQIAVFSFSFTDGPNSF